MLVYQGSKEQFVEDVLSDDIADIIKQKLSEKMHRSTPAAEYNSWANSLRYMKDAVDTPEIPDGCGVAIEYNVPLTSKRVDFILSGRDADGTGVANIVELKQWSEAKEVTDIDAVVTAPVQTYTGGALREVAHPSYQAWSYAQTISDFNSSVQDKQIELFPCAYAHNYEVSGTSALAAPQYRPWIEKAPLFGKHQNRDVRDFLKLHIAQADDGEVLRDIDNGRIRPSKSLQDALGSMLEGNPEFVLLDDQKVFYEKARRLAILSHTDKKKRVYIVKGGPGTGKSVIAINLLVELTRRGQGVQYVTRNRAPREVYREKLAGKMTKKRIEKLFRGALSLPYADKNSIDTLVIDEAHRLQSADYRGNLGPNQIQAAINAAWCSIFFLDESQRVTVNDIGSEDEIRKWAAKAGAEVFLDELQSQFRCDGSDGYLSWLDDVLQIRETANYDLDDDKYDFEVVDSPAELQRMIVRRNANRNKARLVAGYCWKWPKSTQSDPTYHDITIGDWSISWNLGSTDTYAIDPDSVNEAGCIHTVQGLEFDYVGVIIGPDMAFRDGHVVTDYTRHPGQDRAMKGLKTRAKKDPAGAQALGDELIRNTYRTLMTRGMKGCYVYCCDQQLADYLRKRAHRFTAVEYSSKKD